MPTSTAKYRRLANLPIFLLLAVNLISGLLTFQDYGVTWDEPLYYAYAEHVPYAYSIPARLDGTFDLNLSFEPSVEDHKRYGPAYLLAGRPLAGLVARLFDVRKSDGWHLVNFLSFQVSIWLVYVLARRWVSPWAAFGSAALFATQPVLWGHGFINPKDTPYSMIVLASLISGLALVDRITALSPQAAGGAAVASDLRVTVDWRERRWQRGRWIFLGFALGLIILGLVGVLLSNSLQSAVSELVTSAYHAPPGSFTGKLFAKLAANAGQVGIEAYQAKAAVLVSRAVKGMAGLAVALAPLFLWLWLAPHSFRRFMSWLAGKLAPLPTRPAWWLRGTPVRPLVGPLLLAGALLGIATTLRIISPLVGLLVIIYFFLRHERRSFIPMVVYGLIAIVTMLALYPFLWPNPLANFFDVLRHMSDNPHSIPVLFNGIRYSSLNLPRSYLPVMLAVTLTIPVWPLFFSGLGAAWVSFVRRKIEWRSLAALLLLFLLPLAYVLISTPAMYDNGRHFLFILPPVFVIAGFAFQALLDILKKAWRFVLLLALLLVPGVSGILSSHPYEYAYFNEYVGGTAGAFQRYDTDYWLTCYRAAVSQVNAAEAGPVRLFVLRQPEIAEEYAASNVEVLQYDPEKSALAPGSLVLISTRYDADIKSLPSLPEIYRVEQKGAPYCLVLGVP